MEVNVLAFEGVRYLEDTAFGTPVYTVDFATLGRALAYMGDDAHDAVAVFIQEFTRTAWPNEN